MKNFLRGWRRKWGLLCLTLAVGSVAIWMRSHTVSDQVQYRSGRQHVQVIGTEPQGLIFITLRDVDGVLIIPQVFESKKQDFALTGLLEELSVRWKFSVGGFRYSEASSAGSDEQSGHVGHGGSKGIAGSDGDLAELSMPINDPVVATRVVIIPYWPIALGFTLLAIYLILRKPKLVAQDAPQSVVTPGLQEANMESST